MQSRHLPGAPSASGASNANQSIDSTPSTATFLTSSSDEALVAGLLADAPGAWNAFVSRFGALIGRMIARTIRPCRSLLTEEDVRDIRANLWVTLLAHDKRKLRQF